MAPFTDQIGRPVLLQAPARRIVSLVPSQTELLAALQLDAAVVGITKFCTEPEQWYRTKTRVGGTKDINVQLIRSLQPDLILAAKEENVLAQLETLWQDIPTWVSDVSNLEDALAMIGQVGQLTGATVPATELVTAIQTSFREFPVNTHPAKAAYLIWKDPYMTVGGDTFISAMLARAGFSNVFAGDARYPEITIEAIRQSGAAYLLLSSEPYPFRERHAAELQAQLPEVEVCLVDGSYFSWYGSRLLEAPRYFNTLRKTLQQA